MKKVNLYTDGACSGNPGPGGFAYAIIKDDVILYDNNGFSDDTTNNKMEIYAAIEGIKKCIYLFPNINEISIYTDSIYTMNSIIEWGPNYKKNGWKKSNGKTIENKELIIELFSLCNDFNYKVTWNKVKAHQSINSIYYDKFNDHVDKLATGKITPSKGEQ